MLLCVFGSFLPLAAAHATLTTYIDQTFKGTIKIRTDGQNGVNGNGQNYIPQPGQPGAPITLQFNQSAGGLGNTINSYGDGIFATSTGGKGGDAYTYRGTSELDGGPGAGGGVGGVIEITNTGKFIVNATGDEAHGIYATSQGGVGSPASDRSSGGGDPGGTGGSGKNVTVILNNGAAISSTGQLSNGVLAQSLGDVAGNGNLTAQNTPSMKDPYPNGSVGGYSGDVVVQLNEGASILTSGANSNGIGAINRGSAGGQGASIEIVFGSGTAGNGGSGGDSGTTTVTSSGNIKTTGNASMGMIVQSSGGNGGYGGDASGNGGMIAGQAGGPGKAGVINITNSGSITTMGTYAPGILAQSFAGSGGVGGTASGSLFYDQGGGASASTNGGTVNINLAGEITTKGDNSQAVIAQSIGGKGGMGGAANADGVNLASAIGGQAGAGGNGGSTVVSVTGNASDSTPGILTAGSGAFGILSQSIGGGGGLVGNYRSGVLPVMSASFPTVFVGGSSGNGGDINMAVSGQVATGGLGAMGIVAQSIGGGGGWMANEASVFAGSSPYLISEVSAGAGGNININLPETTITTLSDNSAAVWAQSVGPSGNGTITINVGTDTTRSHLSGGSNQSPSDINGGAGIMLLGGQNNQVNIAQNSTVTASSGVAIKGSYHVLNSGQIVGSLLGASAAPTPVSLSNYGTLSNAEMVQGDVVNHGHVFVAQSQAQGATHVTGDFTQSSQGTLHVTTDFAGQNTDVLRVDGQAKLDGKIKIIANTLMPNHELTFLQAGSITPNADLQGESNLFTYRSRQVGNTLAVSTDSAKINELSASHGVEANLHAVGAHLQEAWDRGSKPELGTLYAALNRSAALGAENYASALSDLSPGVLAAPAALKQTSMISFSNSLMSCPTFQGADTQMGERDCVWGRVTGNTSKFDGSLGTSGLKSQSVMYQMGTQRNIAPNWFVGVAGAYENQRIRSDDPRQRINGDSGYVGVSLKYENGPWVLAGALTGSYSSFDNTRRVALMGAEAKSRSHVMSISQRLRASYTHAMAQSYVKPYIDLDVIHTRMPSFEERGAGALNLHVQSTNTWSTVISPGVEVGGRFDLKNGYTLRPYASVGVALSSTGQFDTRARLMSAPAGTAPFTSTLDTGRVFAQLSGGVHVLSNKGMDVRLQYDGLLSNRVRSHAGSIKASWSF